MAYSKLEKGKKGDIAILIFVVGVFAVCVLAIVTFLIADNNVKKDFVNIATIQNASVNLEDFYLYLNSGMSPQEAASLSGGQLNGNQLIFNEVQKEGNGKDVMTVSYVVDIGK
jgi:hypothetical protein